MVVIVWKDRKVLASIYEPKFSSTKYPCQNNFKTKIATSTASHDKLSKIYYNSKVKIQKSTFSYEFLLIFHPEPSKQGDYLCVCVLYAMDVLEPLVQQLHQFDWSSGHARSQEGGLKTNSMNFRYGGVCGQLLRDTKMTINCLGDGEAFLYHKMEQSNGIQNNQ